MAFDSEKDILSINMDTLHSIMNILIGLEGGSYLLRKAIQSDNKHRLQMASEMVARNIGRALEWVYGLLNYSRNYLPQYDMYSLNKIVGEACELIKTKAERFDIQVVQVLDPLVGETLLDPRGIHCCVTNLLCNAMDACLEKRNTSKFLRIKVSTFDDQNGKVGFTVSDNGSGMSEEIQKKIFTKFFSTKGLKGTGIGLALTHKIVKEHGGNIYFKSRLGEGSMFTIVLPKRDCKNDVVLLAGKKEYLKNMLGGIHEKSFNH